MRSGGKCVSANHSASSDSGGLKYISVFEKTETEHQILKIKNLIIAIILLAQPDIFRRLQL